MEYAVAGIDLYLIELRWERGNAGTRLGGMGAVTWEGRVGGYLDSIDAGIVSRLWNCCKHEGVPGTWTRDSREGRTSQGHLSSVCRVL